MLINLNTLHQPKTLGEALLRLSEPETFPLYGGAALQMSARRDVKAAIDLRALELDYVRDSTHNLRLGVMLTLEQVRIACAERAGWPRLGSMARALASDFTETQRHTLTLGDLLVMRNPQSQTLALLLALGANIKRLDVDMHFTLSAWLQTEQDVARYLLGHVRIPRLPRAAAIAFEKVARTPVDAPIVGAVVCAEWHEEATEDTRRGFRTRLALTGAHPIPTPQPTVTRALDQALTDGGDLESALEAALDQLALAPVGDFLGSAEYRAEMARVVARRALSAAHTQLGKLKP